MERIERDDTHMADLTVVCTDPDTDERSATGQTLAEGGYEVVSCGSLAEATEALEAHSVDCVVTEYTLPDGTGLDLAGRVRDRSPDVPCILFTNESSSAIRTDRREDVVVEYLPKGMPKARESLVRLVGNSVSQCRQVGYPLPDDEDERLAALAQYDQPGMETADSFDRLTALARTHFGVDVAFVGLVDAHEERFLACAGENWETVAREDTMCTHTILEDELLVVEDVDADPRFRDNERLAKLDIEAYAGVPLRTPGGAAIGAFCLTHYEPRSFSDAELDDLERFGDEAMEQLELRRMLNERDDTGAETGEAATGSEHS